jgi:hypothetical protein
MYQILLKPSVLNRRLYEIEVLYDMFNVDRMCMKKMTVTVVIMNLTAVIGELCETW